MVLVAMLVLPVLVTSAPTVPLPNWAYPGQFHVAAERVDQETSAAPPTAESSAPLPLVDTPAETKSELAVVRAHDEAIPRLSPASARSQRSWQEILTLAVGALYTLGAGLLFGQLVYGLVLARKLVRDATPVDLAPEQTHLVDNSLVLASSALRVPVTVGWFRPVILLPADWSSWSEPMLAAVLTHEQAHVRRGDVWVNLIAQLNRSLYWFHPLAWFLGRRLAALAEAACDDAVIESLGDRTGYARHLLDVASRLTKHSGRLQPAGVAMAVRPTVEHRIETILDERRPLSRRVGWLATLLLAAVIAPAVLLAAGITAERSEPKATASIESSVVLASETGSLILTVLDDNDVPVPGAKVKVRVRQLFMGSDTWSDFQTDASGQLKIDVPTPAPHYFSASVELSGYAPFLAEWENAGAADPIPAKYTVWLDPGRTIGGVVQDGDGEPIEGVAVRPFFNVKLREERTHQMGAGTRIKTDATGRWIYASLPTDVQQLPITYEHPGYIVQRASEPVSKFSIPAGGEPQAVVMLNRGLTIAGSVTGADGKPLAGATARYFQQGSFRSDAPTAATDTAGKFLFNCGEAGSALLTISAPDHAPAMRTIDVAEALAPIEVQLTEGTPLKVRVVGPDQLPVEGAYVSLWNWDEQGVYGSLPNSRGKTGADGVWQWSHAPQGTLEFAISCLGFSYVRGTQLTPGDDNVVALVPEKPIETRTLKMSGKVVDAETGAPVARFHVTPGFQRERGGNTYWHHESRSRGRNGAYLRVLTPNDVADGTYAVSLRVEAEGYAPATVEWVIGDEHSHTADVSLERAAEDTFLVLTPSGEPAAQTIVAVCTPDLGPTIRDGVVADYSTCERATTGSNGRVSISPQSGLFALMAVHDSAQPSHRRCTWPSRGPSHFNPGPASREPCECGENRRRTKTLRSVFKKQSSPVCRKFIMTIRQSPMRTAGSSLSG